MRREAKLVPIKQMKIGDKFDYIKTPTGSRFAGFELLEFCGAFCKLKVYDREENFSTEGLFVEVPLSDEEFKAKYKQDAAAVVEQLKNKMSIHDDIGYHEMWNSWIQTDAYEFAAACREYKIRIIGWFEYDVKKFIGGMTLDIGIVAENENGRFWCHARKDWIDGIIEDFNDVEIEEVATRNNNNNNSIDYGCINNKIFKGYNRL